MRQYLESGGAQHKSKTQDHKSLKTYIGWLDRLQEHWLYYTHARMRILDVFIVRGRFSLEASTEITYMSIEMQNAGSSF